MSSLSINKDKDDDTSSISSADNSALSFTLTSSEGIVCPDAEREGYVEIKKSSKGKKSVKSGDKWNQSWVIITRGSLHFYKHFEKNEPYMSLEAGKYDISEQEENGTRIHAFRLSLSSPSEITSSPLSPSSSSSDKKVKMPAEVVVSARNKEETVQWRDVMMRAKAAEPCPPPLRMVASNTQSALFKAKKGFAGRAATTMVGEAVLMKAVGDQISHLFVVIKRVVAKHHDKDTAKRVHKLLIKITLKIAMLVSQHTFKLDDLVPADRPLREAFNLMSKFYNGRVLVFKRQINPSSSSSAAAGERRGEEVFKRINAHAKKSHDEAAKLLLPYMSPKNMNNLTWLIDTLSDPVFLTKVWMDTEMSEELDEIDEAMTTYTQFHF